jgi:hypothetical protein
VERRPWEFRSKFPGMRLEEKQSDVLWVRWDGWIMGRTPAARRCNALVRECRGFTYGLTLKVGGLSLSHLREGSWIFFCAFANFSQHSQISSRLALSGLFERIVLKSHHRGQGSQGLNGRDGQRGARRFVVKYRVGRSGVDRCVRRAV